MRFSSLSEAILHYAERPEMFDNLPYKSSLSQEIIYPPTSNQYENNPQPVAITYGSTIWGLGKIIDISKPDL